MPRLYHGVATLVASGAIWTGGTNPQVYPQTPSQDRAGWRAAMECLLQRT